MIILRKINKHTIKLFSFITPFPKELREEFEFNRKLAEECNIVKIDIQPSNDYNIQFNKSSATNRSIDNKFRKDISKNPNTWFNNATDDDPETNTHFLGKESNTSTSKLEDRFVTFSKKINKADRFNYRIYRPQVTVNEETGEKTYYQKIVLSSCLEHTNNGVPGSYVKGQTGNVWHPKSKSTRNKLKEKKKSNKK